ncbi:unnamed protein product, partial [Iphiclides podalirius]
MLDDRQSVVEPKPATSRLQRKDAETPQLGPGARIINSTWRGSQTSRVKQFITKCKQEEPRIFIKNTNSRYPPCHPAPRTPQNPRAPQPPQRDMDRKYPVMINSKCGALIKEPRLFTSNYPSLATPPPWRERD